MLADVGSPLAPDDYALCVYASPSPDEDATSDGTTNIVPESGLAVWIAGLAARVVADPRRALRNA